MAKAKDKTKDLVEYVGCCGTYCKTCQANIEGFCKGCKLGYRNNERDINKAKCLVKVCCVRDKKLDSCADCKDYSSCKTIQNFYSKKGYKYKRYHQSIEYIRKNGYKKFIALAEKWKGPYGKLD